MCGIVGYIGFRRASERILEGLQRLEYRGYDSSGVSVIDHEGNLSVQKAAGRLANLESLVADDLPDSSIGIGHTRWATHGPPTDRNAHPHLGGGCANGQGHSVAIVHNGVVENYHSIKARLEVEGYVFQSETDSEVIAHLIDSSLKQILSKGPRLTDDATDSPCVMAVREAISQLRGTYGLLVLFQDQPDLLVAARFGSPLVIGVGNDEFFIASDASPLAGHTDRSVYLADHEVAVIKRQQLRVIHRDAGRVEPTVQPFSLEANDVGMGDYAHFMLKEIHEQSETVAAAMRGRIDRDNATSVFGGLNLTPSQLQNINRIVLTGCGTSWHAALVGEYL
ncbi:MAG: glutamine--fructose-6-phosphate aminotransferase, partial [Planctomycetaceae bacterium]|nr:glutamine--fructose-6-phosphate aminotransferase [Planctomycetaceae bacterium]